MLKKLTALKEFKGSSRRLFAVNYKIGSYSFDVTIFDGISLQNMFPKKKKNSAKYFLYSSTIAMEGFFKNKLF